MKQGDHLFKKVAVVCVAVVLGIVIVCVTVYGVNLDNNARAMREAKLQEEARKSKAREGGF